MTSWTELLEHAEPKEHVVHLYGSDDQLLTSHASQFLAEGLKRGEGLLVVATPEHVDAIIYHLGDEGVDTAEAVRAGHLLLLDAETTLARFLVEGEPSWPLFQEVVGGAIGDMRTTHTTLRAFGEMVGLLWSTGRVSAAVRLEEYWNRLLEDHAISLFCAYPIDVFHGDCEEATLSALVNTHTHVFAAPRTLFGGQDRGGGR
jgi:hypothetical protein